jgi:hypothetical protein
MRRIFADRGMTLGMKCATRVGERDNEEAVIGTQLRLGDKHCRARRLAQPEGR